MNKGFERWVRGGITAICTMVDKGRIQSFQYLNVRFGLEKGNLFRYLQIRDYL